MASSEAYLGGWKRYFDYSRVYSFIGATFVEQLFSMQMHGENSGNLLPYKSGSRILSQPWYKMHGTIVCIVVAHKQ